MRHEGEGKSHGCSVAPARKYAVSGALKAQLLDAARAAVAVTACMSRGGRRLGAGGKLGLRPLQGCERLPRQLGLQGFSASRDRRSPCIRSSADVHSHNSLWYMIGLVGIGNYSRNASTGSRNLAGRRMDTVRSAIGSRGLSSLLSTSVVNKIRRRAFGSTLPSNRTRRRVFSYVLCLPCAAMARGHGPVAGENSASCRDGIAL